MSRPLLLAGFVALAALALGGCPRAGLSGSYTDAMHVTVWKFEGDGTFTVSVGTNQTMDGTYKLEGSQLTITPKDVDAKPATGSDAEVQKGTLSSDGKTLTIGGGVVLTKTS